MPIIIHKSNDYIYVNIEYLLALNELHSNIRNWIFYCFYLMKVSPISFKRQVLVTSENVLAFFILCGNKPVERIYELNFAHSCVR